MFGFRLISDTEKKGRLPEVFEEQEGGETTDQSVELAELDNTSSDLKDVAEDSWLNRLRPRRRSSPVLLPEDPPEPPEVQNTTSRLKWQTLRHNGPLFAPPYRRLPTDVKFYYDDSAIELTEQAEEVATLYAALLDTNCVRIDHFNANFFANFRSCLSEEQRLHIVNFELCDFWAIHEHLQWEHYNGSSGSLRKQENERYGYCFVDGEQRRVLEYRLRPPGLYYPLPNLSNRHQMGTIRPRVLPEDIIINCDEFAEPPAPPPGHRWKQVVHDRRVSWLCSWTDVCSGRGCYMRPTMNMGHFPPSRQQLETARRLQQHLGRIRCDYHRRWYADDWFVRQRSVALYCIDRLAMTTSAVGHGVELCSLRVKQLLLNVSRGANCERKLKLKFANGKERVYIVHPEIHYNLTTFVAGRLADELIFDELSAQQLEDHLEQLMDGLTAQIFRICNASRRLQKSLDLISPRGSLCTQLRAYNQALKQILNWYSPSWHSSHLPSGRLSKRFSFEERRLQQVARQTHGLVQATFPYLDPRITIAWCLRGRIPFHIVCGNTKLHSKLQWAIQSTTKEFRF